MPAGVTMSGQCICSPIHTYLFALVSACSFPSTPLWPFTHINVLGRSVICLANLSSIYDRGIWCISSCIFVSPLCYPGPPRRVFPMPSILLEPPHLLSWPDILLSSALQLPLCRLSGCHLSILRPCPHPGPAPARSFHPLHPPSIGVLHLPRSPPSLILLDNISLPTSAMPVISSTLSLLLPLYAPITHSP